MIAISCLTTLLSSFLYYPTPQDAVTNTEESPALEAQMTLQGVVLEGGGSISHDKDFRGVKGFYVDKGVFFPGSIKAFEKKLAALMANQQITRENLLSIKNEILKHYSNHRQHMLVIEIPEQEVTAGVVRFVIMPAKIGKVTYRGNRWCSEKTIKKGVDIHPGETVDEVRVLNNLSWLNENPFHYSEAVLSPGNYKGETDIEIVTKDRFPVRLYAGADNTGVESTGRGRFYGGATWGNAFWINDLLTYQYTSNSTFNKFHSQSLNYTSFLPWQHIFSLYGGYSKIEPDVSGFVSHGKEAQASVRYKIPFNPLYTDFQHQLSVGFDYKYITSNLFFVSELNVSTRLMNAQANVTQAMVGYMLEYKAGRHQATFNLELFGSPAKWISHQTNGDYAALRFHAMPRYAYADLALGDVYTFNSKYSISALFRAQGSTSTLIPSEQFKLGGYNTVRGYEESVFISDNALLGNLEFRSRPFSIIKKWKDELTLLAFADAGWGYNYHPFDGITKAATLVAGPGVRYVINPYLLLRADYGFRLHKIRFDETGLGMWHLSATMSY